MISQVMAQIASVVITVVWSGVVSFVSLKVIDSVVGLRADDQIEEQGLDSNEFGETAYN